MCTSTSHVTTVCPCMLDNLPTIVMASGKLNTDNARIVNTDSAQMQHMQCASMHLAMYALHNSRLIAPFGQHTRLSEMRCVTNQQPTEHNLVMKATQRLWCCLSEAQT